MISGNFLQIYSPSMEPLPQICCQVLGSWERGGGEHLLRASSPPGTKNNGSPHFLLQNKQPWPLRDRRAACCPSPSHVPKSPPWAGGHQASPPAHGSRFSPSASSPSRGLGFLGLLPMASVTWRWGSVIVPHKDSWAEPSPAKRCAGVLTAGTWECDLIWKQGYCRHN